MFVVIYTKLGCSLINLSKVKWIDLSLIREGWKATFFLDDGSTKTVTMEEKEADRLVEIVRKMRLKEEG